MPCAASVDGNPDSTKIMIQDLLKAYADILMRRQGPDVLPASPFLVKLAFASYCAVGLIALLIEGTFFRQPVQSVAAVLFDAALLCAWLWILVGVAGYPHRLRQSLSAALGCGAIIGFYTLPVVALLVIAPPETADAGAAANMPGGPQVQLPFFSMLAIVAYVVLLAWFATALGHICARALQLHAFAGLGLGIFYVLASLAIVGALFPLGS